jgi:hypothetical protein
LGGFGSGRGVSASAKVLTSSLRCIDIRLWQREGLIRPGLPFFRIWSQGGQPTTQIKVKPSVDHLRVVRRFRSASGITTEGESLISVAWTHCHLGGGRPWFLCPTPGCGRRVAVLYDCGSIACRHCHRLAYPSQRESSSERALRKADRVRRQLNWEPWECSAHGAKPKGMHWKTFRILQTRRAHLMIQALTGANMRLRNTHDFLDGRNRKSSSGQGV